MLTTGLRVALIQSTEKELFGRMRAAVKQNVTANVYAAKRNTIRAISCVQIIHIIGTHVTRVVWLV